MVVVLLAGIVVSCSEKDGPPGGSGLIEATEVIVSAETSGRLEVLYSGEGDKVAAGDILAVIDSTTISLYLARSQATLQAARAQLDNARLNIKQTALDDSLAVKKFERIDRLIKSGSANQQQYDQAENESRKASLAREAARVGVKAVEADIARINADIEVLKKQLDDCTPSAPVSGVIVTTYVEAGELVTAGSALLKTARLDTVTVKIYLPPTNLAGINLGDRAEVDPEIENYTPLEGTVSWISPEAEFTPKNIQTRQARADLVYAVKITIPNPNGTLKIGMPVYVRIPQ
jgi:HlyD family secretion protein